MTWPLMDGAMAEPSVSSWELVLADGRVLRAEQTSQLITWEDEAYEDWAFTDAQGHAHVYARPSQRVSYRDLTRRKGKRKRHHDSRYPTLRWVVEARHHCDGREGLYSHDPHWVTDRAHYECRQCGEVIEPGHGPGSKAIPVSRSVTVTETMTDPPPEWLEGHQGKITHTRGVATGTRERLLSVAEADELIAAELAGRDEAAQAETARQVATALGYPPEFGRPS